MDESNKMFLHELSIAISDWMNLAQDKVRWRALVSAVMSPQVQ